MYIYIYTCVFENSLVAENLKKRDTVDPMVPGKIIHSFPIDIDIDTNTDMIVKYISICIHIYIYIHIYLHV